MCIILMVGFFFQIKKLVFVYLVRYAEEQQDLALLSISTFQKALKVLMYMYMYEFNLRIFVMTSRKRFLYKCCKCTYVYRYMYMYLTLGHYTVLKGFLMIVTCNNNIISHR